MDWIKDLIVPIVVALISSGVLGGIGATIIKKINNSDPKAVAMRLLLQDKLNYLITRELDKGWTTAEQHKMIRQMYTAYKDLEGNGDMDWLMAEYDRLHLQKSERRTSA